jgi:hypothetical protein
MAWKEFDAAYGNDLEESPYWNWHVPETTMGRLRERGLLVEVTVDGELRVAIPAELRQDLREILGWWIKRPIRPRSDKIDTSLQTRRARNRTGTTHD